MKGDFSRLTFDPKKNYRTVLSQQGRVQLDADWNEQVQIQQRLDETTARDVLGAVAFPHEAAGFEITTTSLDLGNGQSASSGSLRFGQGRAYVDGVLCENHAPVDLTRQPSFPGFQMPVPGAPGQEFYCVLDVHSRHVTVLEDPSLREVALAGPDTTTRLQTAWRVLLVNVPQLPPESLPVPRDARENVKTARTLVGWSPQRPTMQVQLDAAAASTDPCVVSPRPGYAGDDNLLYRVEIHQTTNTATTIKWSAQNAWFAATCGHAESTGEHAMAVSLDTLGPGTTVIFAADDHVEFFDDTTETPAFGGSNGTTGNVGTFARVVSVDVESQTLVVDIGSIPMGPNPRVRRWDSAPIPVQVASMQDPPWIALENGIQVRFPDLTGSLPGDYWLIPARVATGRLDFPTTAVRAERLDHHFALLGYVRGTWVPSDGTTPDHVEWMCPPDGDFRPWGSFPKLTEMRNLVYVGGDGQSAGSGNLAHPLVVAVMEGQKPVQGAFVRFAMDPTSAVSGLQLVPYTSTNSDPAEIRLTNPPYQPLSDGIVVETNEYGIATCAVHLPIAASDWDAPVYGVRAALVRDPFTGSDYVRDSLEADDDGTTTSDLGPEHSHSPVHFTINGKPARGELRNLVYVGGDGQSSGVGFLGRPLVVAVMEGQKPVAGASVRFTVSPSRP